MAKKHKKKSHITQAGLLSLTFVVVCVATFLALLQFEQKVMPTLQEISYTKSMSIANALLDTCVQELLDENPLQSSDFITLEQADYTNYSTNTQAVNTFLNRLNAKINQNMRNLPNEEVKIPIGAASNLGILANTGPNITFTLLPIGSASSDYETSFTTAGINQINYKIWINVSLDIQIVNPFYKEKLNLTKKILLVDTIIGGKVPDQYFNSAQNLQ